MIWDLMDFMKIVLRILIFFFERLLKLKKSEKLAAKKILDKIKQGKHVYKMEISQSISKAVMDDLKNAMKKNKPKKKKKKGGMGKGKDKGKGKK